MKNKVWKKKLLRGVLIALGVLVLITAVNFAPTLCLKTSEMDNALDCVFIKDFVQQSLITDIAFIERHFLAGDHLHTAEALGIGIDQVINNNRLMACLDQLHAGVAADVTGAAAD